MLFVAGERQGRVGCVGCTIMDGWMDGCYGNCLGFSPHAGWWCVWSGPGSGDEVMERERGREGIGEATTSLGLGA